MYHVEYRYIHIQALSFKTLPLYMRKKYPELAAWLYTSSTACRNKHIVKFLTQQGLKCVWHIRGSIKCEIVNCDKYTFAKLKYSL